MPKNKETRTEPVPVPLDKTYVEHLRVGDRLFHYPPRGNDETSFKKSPSPEYSLYSVIDLPAEDVIVMVRAFDTGEEKQQFSRSDLLSGQWWRGPNQEP
ncbi:hypothetical protein ACX0G9_31210 [Flavitalea flava]